MITCSWKLWKLSARSTRETKNQLCNFSIQCSALDMSHHLFLKSDVKKILNSYETRLVVNNCRVMKVRRCTFWPRCEYSVKYPPKCIICRRLTWQANHRDCFQSPVPWSLHKMADFPSVVEAINCLITRIERVETSENGCTIGSVVLRLG